MNKFFLTFNQPELEQEYQKAQTQNVKKPVFLFMIAGFLTMNLIAVLYHFFFAHVWVWYLNVAFSIFCIGEIIIFLVKKKMKYFQLAITLTNIQIGVLQLNINQGLKTGSEFYALGSTFMQYQAVLYLISDFPYAVAQFIVNLLLRLAFTIFLSQRTDTTLVINGIVAVVLLSIAIYVKDKNERKNYIRALKDSHMNKITSFLIPEPYFKIVLNSNNFLFDVTQQKLLESFPGYNSEYCCGCNVRYMLRNYIFEQQTLEQNLLKKGALMFPGVFSITCKKRKFKIRISQAEITQLSYIIILEEISTRIDEFKNINNETNKLKNTLLFHNNLILQKFFNWGVLSLILLHTRVLKQVDVKKMFNKLIIIFQSQLIQGLEIEIKGLSNDNRIITYSHQLKIFMIQLINALLKSQKSKNLKILIQFKNNQNHMEMKMNIKNSQTLIQGFNDNYFIRKTKVLLIDNITSTDKSVTFSLKNYPPGSYTGVIH